MMSRNIVGEERLNHDANSSSSLEEAVAFSKSLL
jgi:L-alanine-DL-glutamate epimerase-like enolase superfamily enzyme